ncbi:MAG: BON domain-containing protein [Acidobacteria bacterium]|nr:BON domain-containing protein [Acidobacteriota bacterium]
MRILNRSLVLSLALLTFSVVGINAQTYSGEVSTSALEREVQRQINKLPYYELFDHISFSVDGGIVTLEGKVLNATNRSEAAAAVKRLAGVENVVNNIEVLPLGSFDETIRRDLARTIAGFSNLSRYMQTVNPSMRLIVENGHITLEGYVANSTDVNMANIAARSVRNAFSVTNNLKVDKKKAG